jgi:hypothetical protein
MDEAHISLPSVLETELFGATLAALTQAAQRPFRDGRLKAYSWRCRPETCFS